MKYVIAAAQYPIDTLQSWEAYVAKLEQWVDEAAKSGAKLLMFPEYGAMELAFLDAATRGDLAASLTTVSALMPRVDALHAALAEHHSVYILAASAPFGRANGSFVNRARLFAPNGKVGAQDKLIMTRFEREQWGISGGNSIRLFDTGLGRIGIAICYDVEFPLIARAMCEAGAQLILVPSCTDTMQGFWRVRIGAQARALENQCFVAQSPTISLAPWSPAVDVNCGVAGVFGPPDRGFPTSGVIAEGVPDVAGWTYGEIDISNVTDVRKSGDVLNFRDWSDQPGVFESGPLELVYLCDRHESDHLKVDHSMTE